MSQLDIELAERADRFGQVGSVLLSLFRSFGLPSYSGSFDYDFGGVATSVFSSFGRLASSHPLLPIASAVLSLPFPLQCDVDQSSLTELFYTAAGLERGFVWNAAASAPFLAICSSFSQKFSIDSLHSCSSLFFRVIRDKRFRHALFPKKKHAAVYSKGNLRLAPLLLSLSQSLSPASVGRFIALLGGSVYDDVMQSFCLFGFGLSSHLPRLGYDIAFKYVTDPSFAKSMSTVLKAVGASQCTFGCMLVEGNVLAGRLAASVDLSQDRDYRLSPEGVAAKVLHCDQHELAKHVRAILDDELRECTLPDMDEFWDKRWLWCVNGSHSPAASAELGIDHSQLTRFHTQTYRRMAAEACTSNPIPGWSGRTLVSCSEKLEHGKSRAIYACDTRSYFAFEWLLGPVQRAWRNRRVLLDPGGGGHSAIADRVRRSFLGGGVNLMLDYDDFNSHHSTASMQTVIRELCSKLNVDAAFSSVLVSSFDQTYCKVSGEWKKVYGTLMSGHRGTTFINSVLNAAYLRAAWTAPVYDKLFALHAGDDVFIRVHDLTSCAPLLQRAAEYGCRMNPAKQSLGNRVAEFLRMAIGPVSSVGYFARSVASLVSGNWTNVDKLSPLNAINTLLVGARSCVNRSGCNAVGEMIASAARFRGGVSHKNLKLLCTGAVALEGAPVYNVNGYIRTLSVVEHPPDKLKLERAVKSLPRNATTTYLTKCATELERAAMELSGVSLTTDMLTTSYGKGFNIGTGFDGPLISVRHNAPRRLYGRQTSMELLHLQPLLGCFVGHPLMHLMANRLTDDDLRHLCELFGLRVQGNVREFCFGSETWSRSIIGHLSYADAAMLSKRATAGSILVLNPVLV